MTRKFNINLHFLGNQEYSGIPKKLCLIKDDETGFFLTGNISLSSYSIFKKMFKPYIDSFQKILDAFEAYDVVTNESLQLKKDLVSYYQINYLF